MAHLLERPKVEDYDRWRAVFLAKGKSVLAGTAWRHLSLVTVEVPTG